TLLGPMTPGGAGSQSNSQCTLTASGSSVSEYANTLKLTAAISFTSAFAGAKNLYGYAADESSLNSGWVTLGSWTAQGAQNTNPTADSVTPASRSGNTQSFTFKSSS